MGTFTKVSRFPHSLTARTNQHGRQEEASGPRRSETALRTEITPYSILLTSTCAILAADKRVFVLEQMTSFHYFCILTMIMLFAGGGGGGGMPTAVR